MKKVIFARAANDVVSASPLLIQALAASVLINLILAVAILAFVVQGPPVSPFGLRRALGSPLGPRQQQQQQQRPGNGNPSLEALEGGDRIDDATLQLLLRRAEATYERHLERKSQLVGMSEELAVPFPLQANTALRMNHPYLQDEGSLNIFRKEYMLLPRYPCFEEERVGTWGEGGKWICKIPLHKHPDNLVIYSIGSFGDPSFEESMFKLLGVKTHTFDPFLPWNRKQQMEGLPYVHFHGFGLCAKGEETASQGGIQGGLKDIHLIMKELGHTFIDLFKIDCEGCELDFVDNLTQTTGRAKPIFGQILMEIHKLTDTEAESKLFKQLRQLGYRMFHMEPNLYEPGKVFEVAFIHESLVMPK